MENCGSSDRQGEISEKLNLLDDRTGSLNKSLNILADRLAPICGQPSEKPRNPTSEIKQNVVSQIGQRLDEIADSVSASMEVINSLAARLEI